MSSSPDSTPEPPAKPAPTPKPEAAPEPIGSWIDPTDAADRRAFEDARREVEGERPPHW